MGKMKETSGTMSRGTYERYKETTRGFRDALVKLLPSNFLLASVSDLAKAADCILCQSMEKEKESKANKKSISVQQLIPLLNDLEESIHLREAVAAQYVTNSDDGHNYMIQVLKYCQQILVKSRQNLSQKRQKNKTGTKKCFAQPPQQNASESTKAVVPSLIHRFGDLEMDDSDSDDDTDDFPPEPARDYSIEEDLIKGSWSFQANLFFLSAESLFETVAQAYENLNMEMNKFKSSKQSFHHVNHQTVVLLLQTTAKVNLAIEHMKSLEQSFILEHKKPFASIFHVFAVLIFPDQIGQMEKLLEQNFEQQNRYVCVDLVSLAVRCGFMGPKVYSSMDKILNDLFQAKAYYKKAKISEEQLNQLKDICETIAASVDCTETVHPEQNTGLPNVARNNYIKSDGTANENVDIGPLQWLKNYGHLGGTSGILYTFERMEKIVREPPSLEEWANCCRSEDQPVLQSTRDVMDAIFERRMFTYLLFVRQKTKIFQKLPGLRMGVQNFSLVLPFLSEFDNWIDKCQSGSGTDFSSAFAVHALVYGIFLLEREGNSKRIAVISRLIGQKFENQLNEMKGSSFYSHVDSRERSFINFLKLVQFLMMLMQGERFVWNPLLAGSFLLMVTFGCNMACFGISDIAMQTQTRTTLHLYNALRSRTMLPKIEALEFLSRALVSSQSVWPSEKPKENGFLKSFFLAIGNSKRMAEHLVEFLSIEDSNQKLLSSVLGFHQRHLWPKVKHLDEAQQTALVRVAHMYSLRANNCKKIPLLRIRSGTNSSSFRYMMLQDFPRQTADPGDNSLFACSQQTELLHASIGAEHELLSINWFKAGFLLDQFVTKLLDALGNAPGIAPVVEYLTSNARSSSKYNIPLRQQQTLQADIANFLLADSVFRELEFQGGNPCVCPNSKLAAELMMDFFTNTATKEALTFF
jgi:hypothetical protein